MYADKVNDPNILVVLGSVVGVAGFVLSLVNLFRLRPQVFLTGPHESFIKTKDHWIPHIFTFEVHNAGASGVTLSAAQMVVPGDRAIHHEALAHHQQWFPTLELPLRLEPYDTKVLTLDVPAFVSLNDRSRHDWEFRVEWYGRAVPWRIFKVVREGGVGTIRSVKRRSRLERHLRFEVAPVHVGPPPKDQTAAS